MEWLNGGPKALLLTEIQLLVGGHCSAQLEARLVARLSVSVRERDENGSPPILPSERWREKQLASTTADQSIDTFS